MASEAGVISEKDLNLCLNPCSCGRWLQRTFLLAFRIKKAVLILVLVEDGFRECILNGMSPLEACLNPCSCGRWLQRRKNNPFGAREICLNPCSCGRWLQSTLSDDQTAKGSLNPCSCGRWLQSHSKNAEKHNRN